MRSKFAAELLARFRKEKLNKENILIEEQKKEKLKKAEKKRSDEDLDKGLT